MDIVLSHSTAMFVLDRCARKKPPKEFSVYPVDYGDSPESDWARTSRKLKQFDLSEVRRARKLIDVLIPSNSHLHTPRGFAFHGVGGALPAGSLLDFGFGRLVCAPQLIYIQLCQNSTLRQCIEIGCHICGCYSLEPSARSGVVERRPLSTKEQLDKYLRKAHHLRGARNARKALRWVHDNSASPKETELALAFYLPSSMGGFGFVMPILNYEIPLDSYESAIIGTKSVRIDVYWEEQKVGFEYTSYAEHGEGKKIGEDQRRVLVLRDRGIHIELVTQEQLGDPRQLSILANILVDHGVPFA